MPWPVAAHNGHKGATTDTVGTLQGRSGKPGQVDKRVRRRYCGPKREEAPTRRTGRDQCPQFKAKVVLAALRGEKTPAEQQ